jgi:hypothetical protein
MKSDLFWGVVILVAAILWVGFVSGPSDLEYFINK